MSLRFSVDEALSKGWISQKQAEDQKKATAGGALLAQNMDRKVGNSSSSPKATPTYCDINGNTPQEILWRRCVAEWPLLVAQKQLVWEHNGAIIGRKYSLDIAFTDLKLGVECDGWRYHGKHLKDFKRDRQKDRAMTLNGWRILRFFASEIVKETDQVISDIRAVMKIIETGKTSSGVRHEDHNG